MPSSLATTEKKKKSSSSSSSKDKKSKRAALAEGLGEPVKPTKTKKTKKSKQLIPEDVSEGVTKKVKEQASDISTDEVSDSSNPAEEVEQQVEQVTEEATDVSDQTVQTAKEALQDVQEEDSDDDEDKGPFAGNGDAMTLMNAITEYNRVLMSRLGDLESDAKEQGEKLSQQSIKDTVQNTYDDVKTKYNKQQDAKGTNHSFELPLGDMMKGYGNFDTTPLQEEQEQDAKKQDNEEESTVHGGDDSSGKISIGNGDKDDIVVKVEATKTGITFCIHIPRN